MMIRVITHIWKFRRGLDPETLMAPPDKRETVMARQGFLDSWLKAKREMEQEETRRRK